ncbi:MAG: 50S ribosome-binding GTPase [Phycisphaerae bacterium]|nr:50S ribosome-binding GTPase [Phycisphaerae bacterium]
MQTLAALMTGSGTSAIATVEVHGPQAFDVLTKVFTPYGAKPLDFQVGSILVGTLHDHNRPIDQITLGCEGQDHLALHCHGNPLIAQATMALLKRHGITLTTPRAIRARQLAGRHQSRCQQEAYLALTHCKTLLGAHLLNHQTQSGLAAWAQETHNTLEDLLSECRTILEQSRITHAILNGVTIALVGPPNSGKSTLLNSLSGQDAAIVTDIRGTTRDWVEADCRTERLALHLIDTAGLDTVLQQNDLDETFQHRSLSVLNRADLILLVLDSHQPATQIESHWLGQLPNVPCLAVLNKSDLAGQLNLNDLPLDPTNAISLSAKNQTGLNDLLALIEHTLHVKNFNVTQPLCVTPRQQRCLEQMLAAQTLTQAQNCLMSLLHGNLFPD